MSRATGRSTNGYSAIIEHIFFLHYKEGDREIEFDRGEINSVAAELGIALPKNLGDLVYSFRYRAVLPESILAKALPGTTWIIRSAGRSRYRFVASSEPPIVPATMLVEIKVPDSTPAIITKYALDDEQASVGQASLQPADRYLHRRDLLFTPEPSSDVHFRHRAIGDRRGVRWGESLRVHYVFPVQAKGGRDRLSLVQIEQDVLMCEAKFPLLVCRPIAAQFMSGDLIALFELTRSDDAIAIVSEKHYRLVPADDVTPTDLQTYRNFA